MAYRMQTSDLGIWDELDWDPITTESITDLTEILGTSEERLRFSCYDRLGLIPIGKRMSGFMRDMSLFHGMVHWYYRDDLPICECNYGEEENLAVTDWIARKLRADVGILRQAVTGFGLESKIYDQISLLASPWFFDTEKQLAFSFGQQRLQELRKVRMDFTG